MEARLQSRKIYTERIACQTSNMSSHIRVLNLTMVSILFMDLLKKTNKNIISVADDVGVDTKSISNSTGYQIALAR